jgi:hypothetical protein
MANKTFMFWVFIMGSQINLAISFTKRAFMIAKLGLDALLIILPLTRS